MKNRNKLIFILITAMLLSTGISAQVKLRLGGVVDWDREKEQSNMGGMRFELIDDKVGFGFNGMADFTRGEGDLHSVEWEGEFFLSYHFFGNGSFLDPYVQAGYGNGGFVSWINEDTLRDLALSLYPNLGAGVNVVFDEGLYLGCLFGYRPENDFIPGTDITRYDLSKNQFTLQVGFQLGGRDSRSRTDRPRENDHFGQWKWCWCDDNDD